MLLIALEQLIQGFDLTQIFGDQRPPLPLPDKSPEPLAQIACPRRNVVEFGSRGPDTYFFEGCAGHQLRLFQPGKQAFPVADPVDFFIHRRCDRVQEIEARRIGDEYRGDLTVVHIS